MNQIIISEERSPYYNVALEYELMQKQGQGCTLLLWQNVPSVFIGRNQNLYAECDMDYLKEQKILPVRRFSGGGAVFQDEGNVNFSFLAPAEEADVEQMKRTIERAITALGISCTFSGRNDLLAGNRKFSGHAYYEEDGHFLYHGTLLCEENLEMLERVLKPSKHKLASKGIASVRSRVVNLKEILPDLTRERLVEALVWAFGEEYGLPVEKRKPEKIDRSFCAVKRELLEKLESPEWIYGEAPGWSVVLERHFPFGNVSVHVKVKDGLLEDIRIYTDSLDSLDFSVCEKQLQGRWFEEKEVFDVIEKSVLS